MSRCLHRRTNEEVAVKIFKSVKEVRNIPFMTSLAVVEWVEGEGEDVVAGRGVEDRVEGRD